MPQGSVSLGQYRPEARGFPQCRRLRQHHLSGLHHHRQDHRHTPGTRISYGTGNLLVLRGLRSHGDVKEDGAGTRSHEPVDDRRVLPSERPSIPLGWEGKDDGVVRRERAVDELKQRVMKKGLEATRKPGHRHEKRQQECKQTTAPRTERCLGGSREEPLHEPAKRPTRNDLQAHRSLQRPKPVCWDGHMRESRSTCSPNLGRHARDGCNPTIEVQPTGK